VDDELKQRAPMQWSSSRSAGFTAANDAWMSPNNDFSSRNVQVLATAFIENLYSPDTGSIKQKKNTA